MTTRFGVLLIGACACACVVLSVGGAAPGPRGKNAPKDSAPATQPAQVKIDLDAAIPVDLPAMSADLSPQNFRTKDGRGGWVVRIPGGRPIATPAYADGLLFVGGGYGSHEFYAFDADSGKKVWEMKTADDGPTAAVVEDGYVAFNTESCTIIIAEARTGQLVWQEWLGDPLMSQPAIAGGRVYIAYPGGQPHGAAQQAAPHSNLNGVMNQQAPHAEAAAAGAAPAHAAASANGGAHGVGPATGRGHRLLCADLKTGKHIWEQDITGDVISAPVVEGDQVFFTCFDGTSFALNCADGSVAWKKHNAATSAPLIANGQVLLTEREQVGNDIHEGVRRLETKAGETHDRTLLASGKAEYLKPGNEGNVAITKAAQGGLDSSVGFAAAPATAQLAGAQANVNVATVAAGWAYQGSRAAFANGQILNAQANRLNCIDAKDGNLAWQARAFGKDVSENVQAFSPPAVAGGKLYVCSARGDLLALGQKDGKLGFLYSTHVPMVFQPALARGNVYAGTANGQLICLKTGDKSADGWTAWGGNAQHNKKE